jgi:cardiolipin synthase
MLDAIDAAERSVEFETFVYWSGDVAREVAEALARAARRGVEVRVLLDAAGCLPMPEDVRAILDRGGVAVREFGSLKSWRVWQVDHRTHRKILVCDGLVGFTGGVGIAEEWEGDARNPDEWRETHFRIRGPAVATLRGVFLQHWLAAGENDRTATLLPPPVSAPADGPPSGPASVHTEASDGAGRWSTAQTLFRALTLCARHSIKITTAYFVPEDEVTGQLVAAAERGVEVDVIHPGPHTDHRVSNLAGEERYPELLEAGVRIWRYQKTMIHAKIILIDGVLSCIGSANLNQRSVVKDDEVALLVHDPDLAAELTRDFESDLEDSMRVEPGEDRFRRPWWRRVLSTLTRPFRSQV